MSCVVSIRSTYCSNSVIFLLFLPPWGAFLCVHSGFTSPTLFPPRPRVEPEFWAMPRVPKRQRAGAVQDASRILGSIVPRASVLDCGGPPPLFPAHLCHARTLIPHDPWRAWFHVLDPVFIPPASRAEILCGVGPAGHCGMLESGFTWMDLTVTCEPAAGKTVTHLLMPE